MPLQLLSASPGSETLCFALAIAMAGPLFKDFEVHLLWPTSHTLTVSDSPGHLQIPMENFTVEPEILFGQWLLKMLSDERECDGVNFLVRKTWTSGREKRGASRERPLPSSLQNTVLRLDFSMWSSWVHPAGPSICTY